MRISIIPEDKKIIVDGKTIDLEDDAPWDFDDETIHAIQWRDNRGELEYEDVIGEDPVPNKIFGEDEFDTIVQPYLDYFNSFLTIYEQRELAAAIAEEQNLAAQIEELNLDKLEKEAQLVIIDDLQKQNKELRDEREEREEELSRLQQKKIFDEHTARLELEREKAARESEKATLESQKADEFFEKKSLELAKKYDELFHEFEKEKEAFVEERKQYQELLQMERDKIEKESELLEQEILKDDKENENKRLYEEQVLAVQYEDLELSKAELELQKQVLELVEEENLKAKDEILRERTNIILELDRERTMFEKQKEHELELIMKAHEDLIDKMSQEEGYERLDDALEFEYDVAEKEYKELQKKKVKLSKSSGGSHETLNLLKENRERNEIETGEDKSIDEILSIMDEIDPEKLYNTLTDGERENNEFPMEKAIKWFAALKDVMDKK